MPLPRTKGYAMTIPVTKETHCGHCSKYVRVKSRKKCVCGAMVCGGCVDACVRADLDPPNPGVAESDTWPNHMAQRWNDGEYPLPTDDI